MYFGDKIIRRWNVHLHDVSDFQFQVAARVDDDVGETAALLGNIICQKKENVVDNMTL